jgi:hypothetical protein
MRSSGRPALFQGRCLHGSSNGHPCRPCTVFYAAAFRGAAGAAWELGLGKEHRLQNPVPGGPALGDVSSWARPILPTARGSCWIPTVQANQRHPHIGCMVARSLAIEGALVLALGRLNGYLSAGPGADGHIVDCWHEGLFCDAPPYSLMEIDHGVARPACSTRADARYSRSPHAKAMPQATFPSSLSPAASTHISCLLMWRLVVQGGMRNMHHLPAITATAKHKQAPPRDLPPWLGPGLAPSLGLPQRSRLLRPNSPVLKPRPGQQGSYAGGSGPYAGAAGGIFVGTTQAAGARAGAAAGPGQAQPHQLPQSPVVHAQPLPAGDLFPSMPPPNVNVAKG